MTALKFFERIVGVFPKIATLILGIASICLLAQIFREEGASGVWTTMRTDVLKVTLKFIPVIIVFFTITGAINHLQKRHKEEFQEIIDGRKGTFKMVALAAAMPGPAGGQQLQDAWNSPSANRSKILLCLVGMMALNINVLLFRAGVLGGKLTLIWLCMSLLLLGQVWLICRWKPWTWFS